MCLFNPTLGRMPKEWAERGVCLSVWCAVGTGQLWVSLVKETVE